MLTKPISHTYKPPFDVVIDLALNVWWCRGAAAGTVETRKSRAEVDTADMDAVACGIYRVLRVTCGIVSAKDN